MEKTVIFVIFSCLIIGFIFGILVSYIIKQNEPTKEETSTPKGKVLTENEKKEWAAYNENKEQYRKLLETYKKLEKNSSNALGFFKGHENLVFFHSLGECPKDLNLEKLNKVEEIPVQMGNDNEDDRNLASEYTQDNVTDTISKIATLYIKNKVGEYNSNTPIYTSNIIVPSYKNLLIQIIYRQKESFIYKNCKEFMIPLLEIPNIMQQYISIFDNELTSCISSLLMDIGEYRYKSAGSLDQLDVMLRSEDDKLLIKYLKKFFSNCSNEDILKDKEENAEEYQKCRDKMKNLEFFEKFENKPIKVGEKEIDLNDFLIFVLLKTNKTQ